MSDILLVDDSEPTLLTLAIALRRRGHCVTIASSGYEALNELSRQRFDVLISDVRMPGMSGADLARQARCLPNAPRIILTSAHPTVEASDQIAEAFLRKPIDTALLESLLPAAPAVCSNPGSPVGASFWACGTAPKNGAAEPDFSAEI